jgi:OHCU decarboxylase
MGSGDGRSCAHRKRGIELSEAADRIWSTMEEADWMEAFACHPRIGERKAAHASAKSVAWSHQEQSSASSAAERVLAELAAGNALYEQRFGFTYIVCATGKSAEEMLAILNRRLAGDRARRSCAKPPSSSGRSRRFVWESGWWNERNYHARAGCSTRQAGRRQFRCGSKSSENAEHGPPFAKSGYRCGWALPRPGARCLSGAFYRLTFETGAYLAGKGRTSIYPEISITFKCSGEEHYHLPLLLSDNSYTTYRGS